MLFEKMIDILLPVFNGSKYLKQQIQSLLDQSYSNWRLLVRDDGSTDDSLKIVYSFAKYYPSKILVISDSFGNQGTSGCINLLLQHVSSDYFMFCDQDDVWEPTKIEESMNEMMLLEKIDPNFPILICSDACCIDENDKLLYKSFYKNQKFFDTTRNVHKMLALNIVQGSTALMNRHVKETIKYIPKGLYHDWWIAVNCVYYGKISYLHKPLLKYRQHQANVVGALDIGPKYLLGKVSNYKKQFGIYSLMYNSLSFKPSIIKWMGYKIFYVIKRL